METTATVLNEFEQEIFLQPAGAGMRFINFLIDAITFYVFSMLVGVVLYAIAKAANDESFLLGNSNKVIQYLFSYALYICFYTLCEGALKGRSIGKLVTGTIAVKNDGSPITLYDAFLRSLCRLVPFEAFSAFSHALWHDKWTHTKVVKKQSQQG